MDKYYLRSSDSKIFATTYECSLVSTKKFKNGKLCFVASISPALQIEQDGTYSLFDKVVLSPRHAESQLFGYSQMEYVYVSIPLHQAALEKERIDPKELRNIAVTQLSRI